MTWKPLQLRGLSFKGPHDKEPAVLAFQNGLNVLCGSSDTGKSFIVEVIDFLLGGSNPPRDIPERIGYDRARLVLQPTDGEIVTLERSTSGGDFRLFEGNWLLSEPSIEATSLRQKHVQGRKDSLSAYLLSAIGFAEKYIQKNQKGETQSLSFRNLVRLVLVQEGDITKRNSPILSGQFVNQTADYSVFKLLLTGVDDSALVTQAETQTELEITRQNNNAKVELIDELLRDLQVELDEIGINRAEAEEQLLRLETASEQQQEVLLRVQQELNSRMERRRSLIVQQGQLSDRIDEINGLLARFELLKEHYQIDLERLAAIEESGSLFVHLERKPCPLCGALPNGDHQRECDGDVESVVRAATAEIAKVKRLSAELDQTVIELKTEVEELSIQCEQLSPELHAVNQEIQEIVTPAFGQAQEHFRELLAQSGDMQRVLDKFRRVEQLREKRSTFLTVIEDLSTPASPQVDLSKSVLDDFAQKVQHLLETWDFPGSDRVYFDESTKDIVIHGKPRANRGKGLRAITHAAMTIGLMEFCKDRNLSHPGFVVLDSPLLAYYKPESSEDSLEGSELKEKFYSYLADNYKDGQVIIIENELPPDDIRERISLAMFTKNPHEGRYGFFPLENR